jgi:hypothetical protein
MFITGGYCVTGTLVQKEKNKIGHICQLRSIAFVSAGNFHSDAVLRIDMSVNK